MMWEPVRRSATCAPITADLSGCQAPGRPALEHRRRLRDQRRSPRGRTAAAGRSAAARHVWTADRRHRRALLQAAADVASSDARAATGAEQQPWHDCGSGAHGERRFWELPGDEGSEGGVPGVDRIKAELVRRETARRIDEMSPYADDVSLRGVAGPAPRSRRKWTTWRPSVTWCAEPCTTARSAGTTARTGGRIAGRRATASSSWPASTSRGRGRVSDRHVGLDAGFAIGESRR